MAELQVGVNEKNIESFKALFHENYPKVVGFAYRYLRDMSVAADIAQECFVRLWNSKAIYEPEDKMMGFLYTTARNLSLDQIKHFNVVADYAEKMPLESDFFYEDAVTEEETYEMVYKAIDRLPAQARRVILYTLEGKSNDEIAGLLKISVNSVRTHKQNAYKKLRSLLAHHFIFFLLLLKK